MARLEQILSLKQIAEPWEKQPGHERMLFLSKPHSSTLIRTFGGQIVAQALAAAWKTVDAGYQIHSLHAYFLRAGDTTSSTGYEVEKIRDGRSFLVRRITATENGRIIFHMMASFQQAGDHGVEHSDPIPVVTPPDEIDISRDHLPQRYQHLLAEWPEWDVRIVPSEYYDASPATQQSPIQNVWFKYKHQLGDEEQLHTLGLAYMSDMTLIHAALMHHQEQKVQLASLDHAIWFYRPCSVDEWFLYSQQSPTAKSGRGVVTGRIFNQQGELAAVVVQEGLTRILRGDARESIHKDS
ncbi:MULTISPECIES: acyl-CoA thioesterase II [unclassified Corynebacterium]|uniref:acyl-CoA thioesterase n=1 Tax=unclassified Corynebacterium TaxID=2624378 RepID=UPI00163D51A3|nr:acyl-CoA thioesterase II [Corynebacterium sp. SY003]